MTLAAFHRLTSQASYSVCVCVGVRVRACVCVRERERKRASDKCIIGFNGVQCNPQNYLHSV